MWKKKDWQNKQSKMRKKLGRKDSKGLNTFTL